MANQRDELMNVAQILAELCGVSERTFYRWRELGRAPKGIRLPNRELRVWRSEFLAWLESLREDLAGRRRPMSGSGTCAVTSRADRRPTRCAGSSAAGSSPSLAQPRPWPRASFPSCGRLR